MKYLPKAVLAALATLVFSAGAAFAFPAIVKTDLNLRYGPDLGSPVILAMPGGSLVDVGECYDGWCAVEWSGHQGYASKSYLDFAGYAPAYVAPSPQIVVIPRYYDPYPKVYRKKHYRKRYRHKRPKIHRYKRKPYVGKRYIKRKYIKKRHKRPEIRHYKRKRYESKRFHKRKFIKKRFHKRKFIKKRGKYRKFKRSHRRAKFGKRSYRKKSIKRSMKRHIRKFRGGKERRHRGRRR